MVTSPWPQCNCTNPLCDAGPDQLSACRQARLDFEDEVEEASQSELQGRMQQLQQQIDAALATRRRGNLLRNGLQASMLSRRGCMSWSAHAFTRCYLPCQQGRSTASAYSLLAKLNSSGCMAVAV